MDSTYDFKTRQNATITGREIPGDVQLKECELHFVIFWLLDYFSSWEIRRLIPFCLWYWHTLRLGHLCKNQKPELKQLGQSLCRAVVVMGRSWSSNHVERSSLTWNIASVKENETWLVLSSMTVLYKLWHIILLFFAIMLMLNAQNFKLTCSSGHVKLLESSINTYAIVRFHMTSLKFKLQNYRSCWDFTFMMY